jgi:26S proteasome regulatory subunit (ATPase 3-interacting protein)
MSQQNRPYSVVDIFNNLHKEFGKTCVTRVVEHLSGEGKLVEKVYGKQKVYVVNQALIPTLSDAEMKSLEGEISQLQQELSQSESACKKLQDELLALQNSLTTEEVQSQLSTLSEECAQFETRLARIKATANDIDPKDVQRTEIKHTAAVKEWRKRKRMSMDIVNAILEGYPKSKRELYEDIGLETDEDVGVSLSSK